MPFANIKIANIKIAILIFVYLNKLFLKPVIQKENGFAGLKIQWNGFERLTEICDC